MKKIIILLILCLFIYQAYTSIGEYPRSPISCDQVAAKGKENPGFFWDGSKCELCGNKFCFCKKLDGCDSCSSGYAIWDYLWDDRWLYNLCHSCESQGQGDKDSVQTCCITTDRTEWVHTKVFDATNPDVAVRHTSCKNGYNLYGSKCVKKDNCVSLNAYMECTSCIEGYYWSSDRQQCIQCNIPNCLSCWIYNQCSQCLRGTYLTQNSTAASLRCEPCDAGCICTGAVIDGTVQKCQSCIDNRYYQEDKSCQLCSTPMEYCATCSSKTKCSTCKEGYALVTDQSKCSICPVKCGKCAWNSTRKPAGAAECQTDGCYNGYFLIISENGNYCEACNLSDQKIARCNSASDITQCVTSELHRFIDHSEISQIPHIREYFLVQNSSGKKECILNQYSCKTMISNLSQLDGECLDCYSEREWFLIGKKCQQCQGTIDNCVECDGASKTIMKCLKCRSFENELSSTVTAFYVNSTGFCTACNAGCAKCKSNTDCENCLWSYIKSGATCTKCSVDKCKTCSQQSDCDECRPGYTLWQRTKCLQCEPNCLTCNNRKPCSQCAPGYYLRDSVCHKPRNRCVKWSNNGECSTCANGYIAVNGWCKNSISPSRAYVNLLQGCSGSWYKSDGLWISESR